jgi:hypothetical protein
MLYLAPVVLASTGEELVPSSPCPASEVPTADQPRPFVFGTPSYDDNGTIVPSRAVIMTEVSHPMSSVANMPGSVLVLRDDHLLIFSRAALDLGKPLESFMNRDPRIEEYHSVQLTENVVEALISDLRDADLFVDVGDPLPTTRPHISQILIHEGTHRSWISAIHLGFGPEKYVSPTVGVIDIPEGETEESLLAQESPGYQRSREAWSIAYERLIGLIPEDESEWQPMPGVHYMSFRYGMCPPSEP